MSKELMTTSDIPAYIKGILKDNLYYAKGNEVVDPGYTFRLYNGKWPFGYEEKLRRNAERLVRWAIRYYADAKIISEHLWYNVEAYRVENSGIFIPSASKRKARRSGFRNYIVVEITDPVARILEIGGYVKGGSGG